MAGGDILPGGDVAPSSGDYLASAELYDPSSGSWTATGKMGEVRGYGQTATLLPDGRVLVAGGSDLFPDLSLAGAELYDPRSGTWTATGTMIEGRTGHTATLLPDGRVLVVGGLRSDREPLASAELYDPRTETWTTTGSMAEARWFHAATLLRDGRVLVTGGMDNNGTNPTPTSGDALASAELYDQGSGTWTATGSMATGRRGQTATLLPDGKVLVAGGEGLSPELGLASAELYDRGSGTWIATGNMIDGRSGHTATPLRDGRVLVAGGRGSVGLVTLAGLYDPISGSWTRTGNMTAGRYSHTATGLSDGRVLVVGGVDYGPSASAELYDSGSGT